MRSNESRDVAISRERNVTTTSIFDEGEGFVQYLSIARLHVFNHAGSQVFAENFVAETFKRALHRRELYEYVTAIAVVLKHVLYAAKLPDDAVEP